MNTQTVLIAFGLTLFAGLATGIGSLLTLLTRRTNKRFMAVALGFSAGFMIYVAMIDMFDLAKDMLTTELGKVQGSWLTVGVFFFGMLLIAVIDRLVPTVENPHELRQIEEMQSCDTDTDSSGKPRALMRLGFMTALAIAIHNFPEGLATFASALHSLNLGIAIAVAIAIHNIPEGIAVAIPIYCATGSRRKAFLWSLLSGLSEPLGALIGFTILSSLASPLMLGSLYALVAGIMVFISLDELLPAAREYGSPHLAIYGLIGGMMIMALSLQLLG
jgi:zinc transporter, ZIP family